MRVIATAGHVDHGKSTLLRALTGEDPDRWAEEKSRGLTIDLGFVSTTLASGEEVGFIDVPGHARFVRNMLAGVAALDACLFVVAATDGWMPQSEEHLRILELSGVTHGLVVLTKVGLVDDDWRELVTVDITEHLAGTFLEGAEMVAVDVPAGVGTDELRRALERLVANTPVAVDRGWPRLWVDRSFPIRGAGTVVTGTLAGGTIALDESLVVHPGNHQVRVRGLQSHHASLPQAGPGRRLAVNLGGVSHHQIARGQAVVRPGQWHLARVVDASLQVLASLRHGVNRRGAYSAYLGSADVPVRLRVLGRGPTVEPGDQAMVRLWLGNDVLLPLLPGDRYVLREAGRFETVGGGQILDVDPVLSIAQARPSVSAQRVIRERGWVDTAELTRLTGVGLQPTVGRWVVDPSALEAAHRAVLEACRETGARGVNLADFDERHRALLSQGVPGLVVNADRVIPADAVSDTLSGDAEAILALLQDGGWSPPDLPLERRGELRELERRGLAVQAGDVWFAASAVSAAMEIVAGLAAALPDGFTVGAARDAWGTSRKHAMPLLGHLDAAGVTRRRGDLRFAGPRMPPVEHPKADAEGVTG